MFAYGLMRVMMIYDAFAFQQKQLSPLEGSYGVYYNTLCSYIINITLYTITESETNSFFLAAQPNITSMLKKSI